MVCIWLNAWSFDLSFYSDTSRLATGHWVKVAVSESGIYQITSSDASKWGFSDLSRVRVFGYVIISSRWGLVSLTPEKD